MSLDYASDHSPPHWARPGPGGVTVYSQGTAQEIAVTDHGGGKLQLAAPASPLSLATLLAACEALTSHAAEEVLVVLKREDFASLEQELLSTGAASLLDSSWLAVFPEMLWQVPDLWLAQQSRSYPQAQVAGPHGSHPLRPPKPSGLLYHRRIPWLQQTFSLRALDPAADLELFHAWMNDTRVAAFFEESGTLEYHRNYLSRMQADPHMMPVLGCLDGRPFCYFELYWARENRIGAHYPAGDWDRGWHVLVGDPEARGADYITAWLPSLMHYMFLAEPRTQALVGEPAASHTQQLRNLTRSGFAAVKEFDFAHKRATLVRLKREHFFQARLWSRPSPADPGRPLQLSPFAQLKPGETR
ncbi:acetyltransferase [Leisingera sp. M527]|uniref:GNAT family N-acetyltransferase n=1 Tax=Leisingera sp. M527 TaxID=2867014 RepID=UPI0021A83DFC|nr:GNAT family N-acetyltransferase [Leisingera sp. M527]UWQ33787.1 acetyltransferase [Leisingera sp. M527]